MPAAMPDPLHVLEALDPEQRAAAEAVRGPVCILAGAGTGKTRAITHRIAYAVLSGVVPAGQVLAVTFTARAAGEMRGRLRGLGLTGEAGAVQARTFHAAALRQLSYFWPRVVGGEFPRLVESKLRPVGEAAARCRISASRNELRDLAGEIEWAKATLVDPEGYPAAALAARREPPRSVEEVARVYAAYDEVKRRAGLLDFEDLLLLTAAAIEENRGVAMEVRERYRWFVVDEYQDVNPLQQRLLDAWLGDREDLCVVGDAQQTIYSFTGASPDYLLGFRKRWPDATVVRLVRDYRSTPQVVGLANALLAAAPGERLALVAQRPAGPAPEFAEHPDEPAEAAAVAARCRELVAAGTPPSEIAVLYRVNAQSETYEQALAEVGVAYQVRGGERFFERPEVREAVRLLRGAARSTDAADEQGLVGAVTHVLAAAGWSAEPPAGSGAVRERWEQLRALVRLAEDLEASDPAAGLPAFVAELEQRAAAQHVPVVEGVTLASLHAAKGLEWDAVFLVGLVDGTLPIVHASTPAQVEEERRLLYVGVTRARERLVLSWARSRSPGGRGHRVPSRFLAGLLPASASASGAAAAGVAPARGSGRGGARRRSGPPHCRVCDRPLTAAVERKLGRCEGCPSSMDEALFERLRAWRLDRARELQQPAFCVFTDATLTAIAEAVPATVAELVAIPGVGQTKLDRFGADVLALCAPAGAKNLR